MARPSWSNTAAAPCGGQALKQAVMGDVVLLTLVGVKIVLVHGGGAGDQRDAEKAR
ncbi:MAG: hypothetical protein R2881_08685 [Eubacteriales bacterium]